MMCNVGDYQFLDAEEIHLLLDYRKTAAKELWKAISTKSPDRVANLSRGRGRKMETLIVTKAGFAVVTFLTRKRIANKLGIIGDEMGEPLATIPVQKRRKGRPKKTAIPPQPIDETFQPNPD